MKIKLIILLLVISFGAYASGEKIMEKSDIKKEASIDIKKEANSDIFEKSKKWISLNYKGQIKYENKKRKLIIFHAQIKSKDNSHSYYLKMKIHIKNDKLSITILDALKYSDNIDEKDGIIEKFKDDYTMKTSSLIENLKSYINKV